LLSIKINLLDKQDFPDSFLKYRIHDGRATFTVSGEFELDLSIADEDRASQFYFVDLRFLFAPSSPIPDGQLRESIEWKANEILREQGLPGCFMYLHDLVLTTKIGHFGNLAATMAGNSWTESLRVDYLHRTLVVQYWMGRPSPKSWVEIGIKSGRRKDPKRISQAPGIPFVDIRWLREKQEVDNAKIKFDTENINLDQTLRSVTALHISHILRSMYDKLMQGGMYQDGKMEIKLTTSRREPLDCELEFQLTKTKILKVMIEHVSGRVVLQPPSPLNSRFEQELNNSRDLSKDGGVILSRLRCVAVKEEVEYRARTMGWEVLQSVRLAEADRKRFLPKDMMVYSILRQNKWKKGWLLLSTHGLSSDVWWIVRMKSRESQTGPVHLLQANIGMGLESVESIDTKHIDPPSANLSFEFFQKLSHVASGLIALRANYLRFDDLQVDHEFVYSENADSSELPYILVAIDPSKLPPLLRNVRPSRVPWCNGLIRFSFQGLDPLNSSAKLVAQGHLTHNVMTLVKLNANSDTSVSYEPRNNAFAFHFNTEPGVPIGMRLLECLQRLERLTRALGVLDYNKLTPDHVSLSKVVFTYAADLRACIDFDYAKDVSIKRDRKAPPNSTITRTKSKMVVIFGQGNPHVRIQHHLISILNNDGGLNEMTYLLKATLPALQGLDEIEKSHHEDQQSQSKQTFSDDTQAPPPKVSPEPVILYRSADWYGLSYSLASTKSNLSSTSQPRHLCRFDLRLKNRRDKTVWHLNYSSNRQDVNIVETSDLREKLKEEIFSATGPGWSGLGSGVVCDEDKSFDASVDQDRGVRNLLRTVDRVIREFVAGMGHENVENEKTVREEQNGVSNDDAIMID
jgi:mediator of RNA polymerase II transcription subunit 14